MKVFVTGGGGYIGATLMKDLTSHGHQVTGLVRSDKSAEAVKRAGGEIVKGSVEDFELLKKCARDADGVIHLALMIDDMDFEKAFAIDRPAIEAMADGLAETGSGKPLVVTSGALLLPPGRVSDEDTLADTESMFGLRGKSEVLVKELSKQKGIRGSVIRLAPVVHCEEDKFFVPWLMASAKKEGYMALHGGNNRWPAVHRSDAAVLFRLALERGQPGSMYHAFGEEGVYVKDIVATISKHMNVPTKSMSLEEAQKVLGFMALVQDRDCAGSSQRTQKELGWTPTGPGLIEDMEANYFN